MEKNYEKRFYYVELVENPKLEKNKKGVDFCFVFPKILYCRKKLSDFDAYLYSEKAEEFVRNYKKGDRLFAVVRSEVDYYDSRTGYLENGEAVLVSSSYCELEKIYKDNSFLWSATLCLKLLIILRRIFQKSGYELKRRPST